jgi:DNA-3-methyladenine glycosylase I
MRYHDEEWGCPVDDDIRLFEKISLEGFQAGLSWLTILRKRENFRAAFRGFDFVEVAQFGQNAVMRLMEDSGIVRHRGKIEAVINNAARAIDMQKEFGSLAAYFWQFEPNTADWSFDAADVRARGSCAESVALSKNLKKRGWSFVGPTTCYAFMQAMGMVNDHVQGCYCREMIEAKRRIFKCPVSC